jgi:hypothetical protein
VLVMDRISGKVAQEFIPASIKVALRALYRTSVGSAGAGWKGGGKGGREMVLTETAAAARTARVKRLLRNMTTQYGVKYTDPRSKDEIPKFMCALSLPSPSRLPAA